MKNLMNLGKTLNKQEQKTITGGGRLCSNAQLAQGCVEVNSHGVCLCPF